MTTVVSDEVVRPGSRISDEIRVRGLGKTPARIVVELFGPFATRDAIRCDGEPYWRATITAQGDGTIQSPTGAVAGRLLHLPRAPAGAPNVAATTTGARAETETSLGAPAITTGRGDVVREVAAAGRTRPGARRRACASAAGHRRARRAVGIDLKNGALGVPRNIGRLGWWRDGAAPGRDGAVLIAGHVDSATPASAPSSAAEARRGDRSVRPATGARAPTASRRCAPCRRGSCRPASTPAPARARLVLVTCGGPFDPVAGHYRDNVVVTAFPRSGGRQRTGRASAVRDVAQVARELPRAPPGAPPRRECAGSPTGATSRSRTPRGPSRAGDRATRRA